MENSGDTVKPASDRAADTADNDGMEKALGRFGLTE